MIFNETKYNSHWNTKKLLELGTFARGKSKHRPRDDERLYEGGGYPLIQTGEIKAANLYITKHKQEYGEFGLAQSKLWNGGALCITIAANIAETAILGYPMCFPDSVVGFNAYPTESSEQFMHYVFTYIRNSIQNSASGSIQDNINIDYLSQLDFKVPKKDYQDKIVGILGGIDQKIELNVRICAELEAIAKTLYDYWFTQFDFPNADGKPYRSSGGKMVWNDQLNCKIPEEWRCSTIINHIGNIKGGDWGKDFPEGHYQTEVICIRGADFPSINGNKPLTAPTRYILSKNAEKILSHGDIIVEISGGSPTQSTGRICYINNYTLKRFDIGIITSNFCRAFSTKKDYEQYWLYLLWKALYDADVLFGYEGKTTGIKNLLFDDFCSQYKIVCPEERVLLRFHEIVSPIFEEIQHYSIENDELAKLRDWLLPMLMNGQVTVE